jgi:hypothetical protein
MEENGQIAEIDHQVLFKILGGSYEDVLEKNKHSYENIYLKANPTN